MTQIVRQHDATILELGPRYEGLDQGTMHEFGGILLSEAEDASPPVVILDMEQTVYVGSSFMELLIRAWRRLRARGGGLALCNVQPFCRDVIQTSRLDQFWPLFADRQEALTAMAARPREGSEVTQA